MPKSAKSKFRTFFNPLSFVFLLLPLFPSAALSDENPNLVVNPNFDQDTQGWESLWCRDEGKGTAEIISAKAPEGHHCLKITYSGNHDWSYGQLNRIPVQPGEIYVFSAWVKCENLQGAGQGQLSVVTRDAPGQVMEWEWGFKNIYKVGGWEKLTSRVLIPQGCASIQLRITGDGSGTTYWNGVSLQKTGEAMSTADSQPVTLDFSGALFVFNPKENRITFSKAGGTVFPLQAWGNVSTLQKIQKKSESRLEFVLADAAGNTVSASVELQTDGSALFTLNGKGPLAQDFEFPGPILSNPGQNWVVPMNEGLYVPSNDPYFKTWDLVLYSGHGLCMPFLGLTSGKDGLIAIVETQNDAKVRFTQPQGDKTSSWSIVWQPSRQSWGYERKLLLEAVPQGGYVGIAKAYRAYAKSHGLLMTLKEKAALNPEVDKLVGAVDLWWWKKAEWWQEDPQGEVYGQQMKDAGIQRVLWAHEAPGDSVKALNGLGFLTGRYDIYQDVYSPDTPLDWVNKEGWPQCLDLLPDGDWMKGWISRQNGVDYTGGVLCSACIVDMAQKHIPDDLASHPYHARFLDTTTASPLRECYSPKHPLSRTQDRINKMALLDYVSKDMKLVTGSETGMDMAVPHLDYFEGMMSLGPYRLEDAGYDLFSIKTPQEDYLRFQVGPFYRIPLFELVYHDCVVNYWYWGDSSNRLPDQWDVRDLFNALYGTPPLWIMDPDRWQKDRERFIQSYKTAATVARQTGYSEMLDHEFLNEDHTVQKTEFADGTKVWVNFGEKPYKLEGGEELKAKSWKADFPKRP